MTEPDLSVVVPAYNEAARLIPALDEALAYLSRCGLDWELVIVDDGSQDDTAAVAQGWLARRLGAGRPGAERPAGRVLRLGANEGKGEAVRRGMLEARGRWRLFRDADRSVSMETFERFRPLLAAGAEVVVGSRRVPGAEIALAQPLWRSSMGRAFTALSRLLAAPEVVDFTCGFKCFTARAAREVFSRQKLKRWAFDAEILFLARRLGRRIEQVPVRWTDEPGTKVSAARDAARSLCELALMRLYALRGDYDRPPAGLKGGSSSNVPTARL